jgi:hypothetical protein
MSSGEHEHDFAETIHEHDATCCEHCESTRSRLDALETAPEILPEPVVILPDPEPVPAEPVVVIVDEPAPDPEPVIEEPPSPPERPAPEHEEKKKGGGFWPVGG